jgi:signal recognition particle subunit SRP54
VAQIEVLKQMGSLSDLFDKMPVFQTQEGLRPDERELKKIVAVHDSMTKEERRRPNLVRDPSRLERVGKGCGQDRKKVLEVLGKFDTMRRMMIQIGDEPSLLAKIPGFDQVAQVRKLRGLDLADLFGDAFEPEPELEPEPSSASPADGARSREYFSNLAPPPKPKSKDKGREKRKKQLQKKARKKNRR